MTALSAISPEGGSPEQRVKFNCIKCDGQTDGFVGTERHDKQICRECYGKREDRRPRDLNDLSGKEWAARSKSVDAFPDKRSLKQREHGAAFPQSLARAHIEMFTKSGETVFDPFVGVGTTVDAAIECGRVGVGIEINSGFANLASADIPVGSESRIICADALHMRDHLRDGSVDFVFTSPPYANLLRKVKGNFGFKWKEHSKISSLRNPAPYSSVDDDLGNLPYPEFLSKITEVMSLTRAVLRSGGYSAWVVKDYRDLKSGIPFVNFHGDVIECAKFAGLTLWDIRIVDQTKHRPLVCLGYPSDNYYLNIGHSYVLIFRNV